MTERSNESGSVGDHRGRRGSGSANPAARTLEGAARVAASGRVNLESGMLLNMELSNLAFNERVLELATDPNTPLLERARFVSIFGSNLDEFFMTRVAGFKRQVALDNEKLTLDGITPTEQLKLIDERARRLLEFAYGTVIPILVRELAENGIEVMRWKDLDPRDRKYLRDSYGTHLDSIVAPVYVRRGAPFPHVRNLRPAYLARLPDQSAGGDGGHAVLELPGDVPRLLPLPGGRRFVPLEDVLRENLPRLLGTPGSVDAFLFRVTRSGNLTLDADSIEDIVEAVAENIALRPFQPVVRIEVDARMPAEDREYLYAELRKEAKSRLSDLTPEDVHTVVGPIDLGRLQVIGELPIDTLRYPALRRATPLRRDATVFEQLRSRDVLVRFPRHSFGRTVERFLLEAANDPAVEELYITLYRTNRTSRIVRLLRRAKRNGKAVTALIEVKASFDEQRNIEWARTLESAGIRVLYGSPALKVHAKIASIARREEGTLRAYSYVGTGNLNASTAAAYTDLGLLTADAEIGNDLRALFATMAGEAEQRVYENLVVAPFNMRDTFLRMIERETVNALAGKPARIAAKLNGVADREIVAALYRASYAGVDVDLVVRGICSLRPGVPDLSERIRVVAIAGRFLEHSRIFRFENGGDPEFFIGSADWRGRNLSRRVEVATRVRDELHRARLARILWQDLNRSDAWDLQPDGRYVRRGGRSAASVAPPRSSALAG